MQTNTSQLRPTCLTCWTGMLLLLAIAVIAAPLSHATPWHDDYYAARIPVEVTATKAGAQLVEIDPATVTEWINETAEFPFEIQSFAHDNVRLVSEDGTTVDGAFRIWIGPELLTNGGFEFIADGRAAGWKGTTLDGYTLMTDEGETNRFLAVEGADRHAWQQDVPTALHSWYRFSYRARGKLSPAPYIFPKAKKGGWVPVERSVFDPVITFTDWRETSYFFYTGDKSRWAVDRVSVRVERFNGHVDDLSVRECRVAFVANIPEPGRHRYTLYYAPVEGPLPAPPSREIDALPTQTAALVRAGGVEWLDDSLSCTVESSPQGDLWWIPTTRKLKVEDPAPTTKASEIRVACARNESEPIQVVFKAGTNARLESVSVELVGPGGATLPPSSFDIRRAHYLPIHEPSAYTYGPVIRPSRFNYTGPLPDPLTAFAPMDVAITDPPVPLWIDIAVPAEAAPGEYSGAVTVMVGSNRLVVPLRLTVWDFALPDRPTCRTAFGINQYNFGPLFPYHKVESKADKYALGWTYFASALRYKISPKGTAGMYAFMSEKPLNWKNLDAAVVAYEHELPRSMDELNATSLLIAHWCGPSMGRGDKTVEDGQKEALRLERMAQMLEKHGWLDRAFVWIDEPRPNAYDMIHKWVALLKAQPHARKLKIFPLVYNGDAYEGLGDVADLMAFYDSEYPRSEFSPAYARSSDRKFEPWCYFTRCSQLWIDTPGINNRFWAPKVWAGGGKGMAVWSILQWWQYPKSPHKSHNPWENPLVTWGNGALSFWYPPSPLGKDIPAKDMSIVPSLRLLLTRDGIEDFEYGAILERLVADARKAGVSTREAENALTALRRPFDSPVHWNLCQTYWFNTRREAARAIVDLARRLTTATQPSV